MKPRFMALAIAVFLALTRPASAHRLDEYLQATILTVDHNSIHASMRLIPGIAVSSSVIAAIDIDRDGVFSPTEQQAYAARVLADLTLSADGVILYPRLVAATFPEPDKLKDGLGEIHLDFAADLPTGRSDRQLTLENHHRNQDSAYLVNVLAPTDPEIHIIAQTRNEQQSIYRLDFTQSITTRAHFNGPGAFQPASNPWTRIQASLAAVGFVSLFHLGIRHITEGVDHLLFLLTLLLPAPLLVSGKVSARRWAGSAGLRRSTLHTLRIVTAFTLGHSLTLALAALGFVSLPTRAVEVLIASPFSSPPSTPFALSSPATKLPSRPSSALSTAWPSPPPLLPSALTPGGASSAFSPSILVLRRCSCS